MQTAHPTQCRWRPATPWFVWVLGMCLWVVGACTPSSSSQTAEPDDAQSEASAAVEGGAAGEVPAEPDNSGGGEGEGGEEATDPDPPAEVPGTAQAGMAVPDAIPDLGGGEDPAGEDKPKVNETAALPKAVFTKVDDSCGRDAGVGQKAKAFNLKTPDGKDISLSKYRGRVVLLNFWGTWCKPCLKELPEFSRLYRRYRKHGLTLVAVATDEDADTVADTVKSKKISAKVAIAGQELADKYGARPFPFTFIVDGKGTIVAAYNGYKEKCMGKLEQDLREQLEKRNK